MDAHLSTPFVSAEQGQSPMRAEVAGARAPVRVQADADQTAATAPEAREELHRADSGPMHQDSYMAHFSEAVRTQGTIAADNRYQYVGFWWRLLASCVDGLILLLPICGLLAGIVYLGSGSAISMWIAYLGSAIFNWLYYAGLESSASSATIGKKAIGARVVDLRGERISFGRATGRHFGKVLSGLTLGIGCILAGLTERKQALHDTLAGTLVVRRARLGDSTVLPPIRQTPQSVATTPLTEAAREEPLSSLSTEPATPSLSKHASIDQKHFDTVAEELHQNQIKRGPWERAFAETDGDERLQRARYIKYRVQELAELSEKQLRKVFFEAETLDRKAAQAILAAVDRGELPVNSVRPLDGLMPIHLIAALGSVSGTKLLIAKGSDIDRVDCTGQSTLDYARRSGNLELVAHLEQALHERALCAAFPEPITLKRARQVLQGAAKSVDAAKILRACGWYVEDMRSGWRATDRNGQALRITTEADLASFAREVVCARLKGAA